LEGAKRGTIVQRAIMTKWTAKLAIAGAVTIMLVGNANAEPVKIRAGWVVAPASLIPVLFAKQGLARHQGKSYLLEPVYFSASPAQITAMSVNELEIAALGFSSFPFAVQNAGLADLRIIADEIQDGGKDNFSTHYMVKKDSGIATVADLKGKVLATNGVGTGVHMAMRAMLQRSGLQDKRDYTVIEAPFPTMKAVLLDGKADMIVSTTPFVFDPELQAKARVLFTQRNAMGVGTVVLDRARWLHRQEPRGDGRSPGGFAARRALVSRSRKPSGGDRHPRPLPQAASGPVRELDLQQERLLPEPRRAGEPRRAAKQHRSDAPARDHQRRPRRPQARQPRTGRRSRATPEVISRGRNRRIDRRCMLV
jgi:ABC-type nitrate/sulfonate/bicarbonate transport system substrate-binding protein